jgi:hypothetical protein
MFPIWIVLVFGALFASYTVMETPKQESFMSDLRADVSATNFMAYRYAVVKYLDANPSATGTISDAMLATYWLRGYIRDANWTNVVSGGTLFVYSTTAAAPTTKNSIYAKCKQSSLVGTKNSVTGRLQSVNGFDTGINLPAGIPNNAIVLLGK